MLEKSSNLQGLFEHFDKSLVILTLQRSEWLFKGQTGSQVGQSFLPFFYNFALIYSLLVDSSKVPKYKYIINFSVADTLYMYFLMLKEITNKIGLVHS